MYRDGRSFTETRDFWESQRRKFNTLKHPDSLCAKVKVMYRSPELIKTINELDGIMDEYFKTRSEETLIECFNEANIKYQNVIALMGKELYDDKK